MAQAYTVSTLCFIKSVYGVNCYKVHVGKMLFAEVMQKRF